MRPRGARAWSDDRGPALKYGDEYPVRGGCPVFDGAAVGIRQDFGNSWAAMTKIIIAARRKCRLEETHFRRWVSDDTRLLNIAGKGDNLVCREGE